MKLQDMDTHLSSVEGVGPITFFVFETAGFHRVSDLYPRNLQNVAIHNAAHQLSKENKLFQLYPDALAARCIDIMFRIRAGIPLSYPHPVPEWSLCSMTYEQLVDPVIAPSGHNFERTIIEKWLSDGGTTNPVNGETLTSDQLIPNHALKDAIVHSVTRMRHARGIVYA
jgi:hypothetical protein